MSEEKCMQCGAKLIPVGFTPQAGKTTTRLYWIESAQDHACLTCLIESVTRAAAAEQRVKELEAALKVIAYEPIGEDDATYWKVLMDIEDIARAALK